MPAQRPPRKSHSWGAAHFQPALSQAAPSGAHTGGASAPGELKASDQEAPHKGWDRGQASQGGKALRKVLTSGKWSPQRHAMMRNLVSGEKITSVAGHGAPGRRGLRKRRVPVETALDAARRGGERTQGAGGSQRASGNGRDGTGRPLKDGLCRGGRPAGCAVQLSAGHLGRSWFFRNLFQRKDSESQRILGSRNRNRDMCLLAQNT